MRKVAFLCLLFEGEKKSSLCHHLFFILSIISVLESALERLQKYQIMFIPKFSDHMQKCEIRCRWSWFLVVCG